MNLKTFKLPDLGEGLPEAEIVTWHVAEGDSVSVDQLMVSVETAKAVVDVPSPYAGTIKKLYAEEGDIVKTHSALVDFNLSVAAAIFEDAEAKASEPKTETEIKTVDLVEDSGTVVGKMQTSDTELVETVRIGSKRRRNKKQVNTTAKLAQITPGTQGKFKAVPSVRLSARQQGIDLAKVNATGKFGQVTQSDLKAFASSVQAVMAPDSAAGQNFSGGGALSRPDTEINFGEAQRLRGPRRAMNLSMSASRDQVSQCTLFDDADIHYWQKPQDITARILRAVVAGCYAAPELNAWFNHEDSTHTKHAHIDIAMAVDTPNGLIVPVLRQVQDKDQQQLRNVLNDIKTATHNRTVSPADMANPTITLSNFGMLAGRYATPVIVPPMVAIIGTGGLRNDVVAVNEAIAIHKRIPLSLTFDHRCITGGEACQFLAAMIKDLEQSN